MPVYDPEARKLVIRVVYDGPALAGKTTNLRQLCSLFTRQRRSDLYTGSTTNERTLCLDWLQLDGGLVRGHELRCHLLSVPGQAVLSRRRQLLLGLADATVFVLESSEAGLQEARPMWLSMLGRTGGLSAGVPIVIQANKQDLAWALTPAEIRERWAVGADIPIIAAQASTGAGVRETVGRAIRATANALQEVLGRGGIEALEGHYEGGDELERRVLEAERANPMSAVEVVLNAHGLGGLQAARAVTAPQPSPPAADDAGSDETSLTLEVTASGAMQPVADSEQALTDEAPSQRGPSLRRELPPFPAADLPHGLVWPAAEGRRTLRRVPVADAALRRNERDGQASASLVFEAGIWRVMTSWQRCFPDIDQARHELVRLARFQMGLGRLQVPRSVLAVCADQRDSFWVWSVSLWLTTVRQQLAYHADANDALALGATLQLYGRLVLRAMRLQLDAGLLIDVEPECFGVLGSEGFCLSDDASAKAPELGAALLGRFDEYPAFPAALSVYAASLRHGLITSFQPAELRELRLAESLERAETRTRDATDAKSLLLDGLALTPEVAP